MDEFRPPEKVRYNYKKSDDYRIIFANGMYGGITPRKELFCHFFHEYRETPEIEEMSIDKDGKLIPLKKDTPTEIQLTRELKIGVILNLEQALSIGRWMLDRVEEFKKEIEESASKEIKID